MRLKRAVRTCLITAAGRSGVIDLMERRGSTAGATVLMYHRVLPDAVAARYPLRSLAMPVSAFREQVRWLAEHRRVLPLRDALDGDASGAHGEIVSITFDDGYTDNYDTAAAILEEFGVRGTFYITADYVGTDRLLWFDRAALIWKKIGSERVAELIRTTRGGAADAANLSSIRHWMQWLKRLTPVTRQAVLAAAEGEHFFVDDEYKLMKICNVADLASRGHEIGSHTSTHPLLPQLTDRELHDELHASREKLIGVTGVDVAGIAYPNGDADDRVINAAIEAGYRYGVVTTPGRLNAATDRMRIPRLDMNPLRVVSDSGAPSELAFRAQCCRLFGRWT